MSPLDDPEEGEKSRQLVRLPVAGKSSVARPPPAHSIRMLLIVNTSN